MGRLRESLLLYNKAGFWCFNIQIQGFCRCFKRSRKPNFQHVLPRPLIIGAEKTADSIEGQDDVYSSSKLMFYGAALLGYYVIFTLTVSRAHFLAPQRQARS